ncbi:alpha/beta hydrolase [Puteibacter caeruleilacunae]|nr:alpha/beta hydrolase [Puteibacter caeruleilacunae]
MQTLNRLSILVAIWFIAVTFSAQGNTLNNLKAGKNKVSFKSEEQSISANLFLPPDYDKGASLPAIVVITPASGIKEQTAGIYAERLAQKGFITLAFDHRTFGESEGVPRCMENGPMKVEDIKNALSFMGTVPGVNPEKIAELGICSGAGYAIETACFDARVKAIATVSGFIDFTDYGQSGGTQYMYQLSGDGIKQFQQQMTLAAKARQKYFETGEVIYIDAIPPKGSKMGQFWERAAEYYHNPQRGGAFKTYNPKRAAISLDTRYFVNPSDHIKLMRGKPILAIVGSKALTAYYSKKTIAKALGKKELFEITGAHHFDLYDKTQYVDQAVEKLSQFYHTTLL